MDDGGGQTVTTLTAEERWTALQANIRTSVGVWWYRLQHPNTRRLVHTGALTLRLLPWRERVRNAVATSQVTFRRALMTRTLANFAVHVPSFGGSATTGERTRPIKRRTSSARPRVRIIVNPTSGTVQQVGIDELEEVVAWLETQGIPAEICCTEHVGHATELAREAVKAGMDMVVAAGGDGTVNDVIQALAGHTTALGVLPMGTVNVWAREMNIPLNTTDARQVLVRGIRRHVDLGRAGSRYFLMMSGIGLDAEVARRVEQNQGWFKRLGLKLLDYLATAGMLSVTHRSTKIWIRADGKRRSVNALMVLIGNTRLYGGALTFTSKAVADDGMLDVVVISNGGALHRLGVFARAALHRPSLGPRVRYSRARTLRMEASTPLPVQVDGEVIGTLPMTFTITPGALTVVVPKDAPSELFMRGPLSSPAHKTPKPAQ